MADAATLREERPCFLLMKRGLYYGRNNQGYTGVKSAAGRYFESDARPDCGVTAVHENEAPMFAPACWNDVKVKHLLDRIDALRAALRQVIINAGGAASEDVSDEFLMLAAEEVRLLRARADRLQSEGNS